MKTAMKAAKKSGRSKATQTPRSRWGDVPAGARPVKGGDGGSLPKVASGWGLNARDILAGRSIRGTACWAAFVASLEETADRDDHAHKVHAPEADEAGREITSGRERLLPAAELPLDPRGERPGRRRRYPACQMVGRPGARVGIDSMFDEAAAVASRLQGAGIELGWRTRATGRELREMVARSLNLGAAMRDAVRPLFEDHTRQDMDADELAAEQAGSAFLRARGFRADGRVRESSGATKWSEPSRGATP